MDEIIIDDGDLNWATYFFFQRNLSGEYHHCTINRYF